MHFSIDRTVHTTAFDKPVVNHWLERKIAQTAAGSTEKDRSDDRPLQRRARYRLSYIPLPVTRFNAEGRKCLFNDALGTFYFSYMTSDVWFSTIHITKDETHCWLFINFKPFWVPQVRYLGQCHTSSNAFYHSQCHNLIIFSSFLIKWLTRAIRRHFSGVFTRIHVDFHECNLWESSDFIFIFRTFYQQNWCIKFCGIYYYA